MLELSYQIKIFMMISETVMYIRIATIYYQKASIKRKILSFVDYILRFLEYFFPEQLGTVQANHLYTNCEYNNVRHPVFKNFCLVLTS